MFLPNAGLASAPEAAARDCNRVIIYGLELKDKFKSELNYSCCVRAADLAGPVALKARCSYSDSTEPVNEAATADG